MSCSTPKSPGDLYSVASSSVHRDIPQEYDVIDPESFVIQNGTKSDPFVTFVDCHHPERNSGMYGVDITLVHGIEFNGYSRDAFKIFLQASPHDFKSFKMTIPIHEYSQIHGRCILRKGLSRSFWLCGHKIYQEVVKKTGTDIDNATKKSLRCDAISVDDTEI
eukprot:370928-Ditylum_brightwellii.AAC.1